MLDSDPLLQAAIIALTPAFFPQTNDDPDLAAQAARTAILAHNPADGPQALLAAQAIAFSLAAIQVSGLAVNDPETPRTRTTAMALARSAERCRRRLQAHRPAAPNPAVPSLAVPSLAVPSLAAVSPRRLTDQDIDTAFADFRQAAIASARHHAAHPR